MIVWRGYGAVVLLTTILALFVSAILLRIVAGADFNDAHGNVMGAVALAMAAGICFWIGTRLEQRPSRTLRDETTGQQVVLREHHDLFFIPVQTGR